MNFYQRAETNDNWIKKFGCAFLSSLAGVDQLFNFTEYLKLSNNDWLEAYRNNGLFDKSGWLLWYRLPFIFPKLRVEAHLWNDKHKDIKKYLNIPAIISVDGQEDDRKPDHFVLATKKTDDIIYIYDPYYDDIVDVEMRYGKGTLDETVFSIINLRSA